MTLYDAIIGFAIAFVISVSLASIHFREAIGKYLKGIFHPKPDEDSTDDK